MASHEFKRLRLRGLKRIEDRTPAATMSSEKSSRCEALRKAGNEIYSQVRDGCYGSCVLRLRLGKALNLYEEALKAAGHDKSERASSYKNLAAANWLWGKSEWQIYMQGSDGSSEALQAIRATKERISKSLKFYLLAFELGESGTKPEIWLTQLQETIGDKIIGWVTEQIDASGELKEQLLLHEFIFESIQARCQGDAILERALFEDEAVSKELVWDAIDWYRHSVSLSKEKNPESDAIALSRIGKVYSSVLKSEKHAYPYHLESTEIAQEIMCPRIAESEWYKYSSLKVHQYQIEQKANAARIEEAINVIKV
ncbi:hypothetical protein SUGI_0525000 [Cryptomeria japonica]|nr:hypothetical protein SUGI_0525000 [Cryptomeria japonica]